MRHMENVEIEVPVECPVCMLMIVRPTKLPCKHVYCQGCARTSLNFKWECPMCRHMPPRTLKFDIDDELLEVIKGRVGDPELWEAREK